MARANYNLIKFIRRAIYQLKREYGSSITLYTLDSVSTDYNTGVKTSAHTSYEVTRAIVLPTRTKREVIQSISMISANKKFVQGGTFDSSLRTFIIDRSDLPKTFILNTDYWLVYEGKRYEIKWIDEFEQKTAWVVIAKALEGHAIPEDIPGIANGNLLEISDTAVAVV